MADDHSAPQAATRARWTRLFTAFRVALDLKKLLLAAGGIVSTALGWWLLGLIFYTDVRPEWSTYSIEADKQEAWNAFKRDRKRWNLMHEMAAPAPVKPSDAVKVDAGDVADSRVEFELLNDWHKAYLAKTKTLAEIEAEAAANDSAAFAKFKQSLVNPATKPASRLRSWPWAEERGPNQYLLAEGLLRKDAEGHRSVPWARGEFFGWFFSEQLPVLVEPLMKFLAPINYFFNSSAGGFRIRLYLILMILCTVATWGYFGGAICRIAAVQIARNEKVSLGEAVAFAKEKCLNLFTAPLFPLVFLGILTFVLASFGLIEGFTYWFGDIVLAGLLFPVVIVLGLIMAVVVVGLVGWPLMNPTIAVEGSDNFDALSRSYSYVYQAFWHYLGYWSVALVYGAALIFFVGFMGSLVVYMGKWGLSRAPGLQSSSPANDRDPAYLFYYAPTSFDWRDLLIKDNPHAFVSKTTVTSSGAVLKSYDFTPEYEASLSVPNKIGAVLVGVWVGLFFLLVVGFGYSYFWTASTLIYYLMRQHVDDTEVEEVFYEENEAEPPPSSVMAAPGPKPNTVSLNVVDGGAMPAATPVAVPSPASMPLPGNPPSNEPPACGSPPGDPPSGTP